MNLSGSKKSLQVIHFYTKVLLSFPWESIQLIILGFFYRLLNVVILITVIKIFLLIINPAAIEQLAVLASHYSPKVAELDNNSLYLLLLGLLGLIILILFIIGKIQLVKMKKVRKIIMLNGSNLCIHEKLAENRNFALDSLTIGYDSIIKLFEILIFFCFLSIIILTMNKTLFIMIFFLVPLTIIYLVYKGKEETFVQLKFRKIRQVIGNKTREEYLEITKYSNLLFSYGRNNLVNSDLLSGLGMLLVMTFFFFYQQEDINKGNKALILIFSIRFAIMYAKEGSIILGRLLQQRAILSDDMNIRDIKFISLKEDLN